MPTPTSGATGTVLLYTTLDSAAAVSSPVTGTGVGSSVVTSPANDFVPAHVGNGVLFNGPNQYVQFKQTDGTTQNVDLTKGTVDFWFQPNFNGNDGIGHHLFSIGTNGGASSMYFNKTNTNYLELGIRNAYSVYYGGDASGFTLTSGVWTELRVTWDGTVAAGVQDFHIYVNGTEVPTYVTPSTGPFSMGAASASQFITLGAMTTTDARTATGIIDEFKIYDGAVTSGMAIAASTPTPTPKPTTPPATNTPTPTTLPSPSPTPSPTPHP